MTKTTFRGGAAEWKKLHPDTLEPVAEKPKRWTLSQTVEKLLDRAPTDKTAVTIGRSASGDVLFEVKIAHENAEVAESEARTIYDRLAAQYPARNGSEKASVELTRNAKGETQIEVSLNGQDLEAASAAVSAEYARLRGKFPLADGTVGR